MGQRWNFYSYLSLALLLAAILFGAFSKARADEAALLEINAHLRRSLDHIRTNPLYRRSFMAIRVAGSCVHDCTGGQALDARDQVVRLSCELRVATSSGGQAAATIYPTQGLGRTCPIALDDASRHAAEALAPFVQAVIQADTDYVTESAAKTVGRDTEAWLEAYRESWIGRFEAIQGNMDRAQQWGRMLYDSRQIVDVVLNAEAPQ
jgi:hypothetical protein